MSLQRWEGSWDRWVGLKEPAPSSAPVKHSRNATSRSNRTAGIEGLTVTWRGVCEKWCWQCADDGGAEGERKEGRQYVYLAAWPGGKPA